MLKQLFSPYRLRQGLTVGLLGLIFSGSFQLAQRPASAEKGPWAELLESESEEDEENDGDRVYPDRPDLAFEQEADLTRDPATGTVPRERLLAAARYNESALKTLALQRPAAGSISTGTWTERGPSNVGGRILGLLVDPTDASGNTVWAGTAGGGLWKATNATSTSIAWQKVNTTLGNQAVTTIAATPGTSPQVLYCGTGEGFSNADAIRGAGIWKSTDGGVNWAQLAATNNSNFYYVQKVLVHPVTKDVYAATRTGLWRSQNGGTNWTLVLGTSTSPASSTNSAADIEIGADNTLYAGFGLIFSTDGIYRSDSGNAGSWTKLNTLAGSGLPTTGYERLELACAPSSANCLYALFQSSTSRGLLNMYRSLDRGNTWAVVGRPGGGTTDFTNGQGWYNLAISVSPANPAVVYVGGLDLWLTTNATATDPATVTWTHQSFWNTTPTATNFVHADHHAIAFVPTTTSPANKAFFGNDGGLFYSANASVANATFSTRDNGLNVTQFYALAMHPTSFNYFLAGAQDNGTQKFTAAGVNATSTATGGDGGYCAIDQNNPAIQFSSYVYNQYRRSTNGGSSFTSFNISASAGSFINPFDYDSRSKVLYGAYTANTYLAWTNAGTTVATATTINPSLGTGAGTVTHVTVSPATDNRIYVGTNAGKVFRVDNANTSTPVLTTLRTGPAATSVSCVAVDPTNEQHLLVTYSNYGVVSVYETLNATAATPTWTSVEGALPDMPVRWALFDPRNTTRALLATEMGIYSTDLLNGASTVWTPATGGLLNTRVTMLRYRSGDKLVAASTHGRGLFTSTVFAANPLPVTLASFTGRHTSEGVALQWQTASERNARSFEVERSTNAVEFARLGAVAAAGSSTTPRSYAYTDAGVSTGTLYYRLRQVDQDGTVAYSPVVAVQITESGNAASLLSNTYPNPFSEKLTLELGHVPAGNVAIALTDAQGRRVFSTSQRTAARSLTLGMPSTLTPGTYVLTVSADGKKSSRRVVRE